jgi:uncharacterized membrane protein
MSFGTSLVLRMSSAAFAVLWSIEGLSRYRAVHNRTFDLALYARQAWGLAHGDIWDPIVNAHFLGTHVALVLWPLGLLGRALGTVPVLIVAQALAFALATLPLAQIGARRRGRAARGGGLAPVSEPRPRRELRIPSGLARHVAARARARRAGS